MSKGNLHRRAFLKRAGLSALSLPSAVAVGKIGNAELVASPDEYGGFLVRRFPKGQPAYQVDEPQLKRFDQRNEVFSRGDWDPIVIDAEDPFDGIEEENIVNNASGYTRLDYAFGNSAWTVAQAMGSGAGAIGGGNGGLYSWKSLGGGPMEEMPPWDPTDWTPEEVTQIVKKASLFYGASLAGVAHLDESWIYSHRFTKRFSNPPFIHASINIEDVEEPEEQEDGTLVIPRSMNNVIVMAFEMDEDAVATYPDGPGAAATGNGYSRMTFTAACLAQFIRGLGYKAIPCGNCTGLSIPMAIDAGLGELGRLGLLITPKYGPRVRLAKVLTNMPLVPDQPISFGVTEFCDVCGKCAEQCPGEAISSGDRTTEPIDFSNSTGILRWPVNHPKCHLVWASTGLDCANCIRCCPFNKPEGWLHDATRLMIGAGSHLLDKAMLKLDDASGYGPQADVREYWTKERFVHIKE
jgi:epoxyqueuosine reductase